MNPDIHTRTFFRGIKPGLLFMLFMYVLLPSISLSATVEDVKVNYKGRFETAENVRKIIDIQKGDELDENKLQKSKCMLGKSGFFSDIVIERQGSPNGNITLIYHLSPKRYIRSIRIKNNFPIYESEIRRKITAKKGDELEPTDLRKFCPVEEDKANSEADEKEMSELEKQARRIEEYFEKEGFFATLVDVEAEPMDEFGNANVVFRVHRGVKLRIEDPQITGLTAMSEDTATRKIRGWGRYREWKVKKGIERLEKSLHKKGYIEARAKVEKLETKPEERKVLLNISVREGPRAKIKIRGARHFRTKTIKKHMPLYEDGILDDFEYEHTAAKIEEFYRSKGFKDVKVTYETTDETDRNGEYIKVRFGINDGDRVVVKDVDFEGNASFKQKKLKKQMLTKKRRKLILSGIFSQVVLDEDKKALEAFYKREGYQSVQIDIPEPDFGKKGLKADITVFIDEGPRTMVTNVRFLGETTQEVSIESKILLKPLKLKPGVPFNLDLLENDKDALLFKYADLGHPYAKIRQSYLIGPDGKSATITYTIIEGKFVKTGNLLIRGNFLTKRKYLAREIDLEPGEFFKLSRISKSRRDIHRLGVMDSVKLGTLGLEEEENTVHLVLNLEERTPKAVDLGLGYDSEDGPQGNIEASHINLFGWAKEVRIKLTGGRDVSRIDLKYIDPKIFGSQFRLEIATYAALEKHEAFDQTLYGGNISFRRRLTSRLKIVLSTAVDSSIIYNIDTTREIDTNVDIEDNILFRIGPTLIYDDRDDFIQPTKGSTAQGKVEYIRDILGSAHFIKSSVSGSVYYTPGLKTTIATGLKFGHIERLDDSSVAIQEIFFNGGNNTVRGYSEDGLGPRSFEGDPLGGLEMGIFNFEIRFPLYKFVHGVVFYDAGVLGENILNGVEGVNWGHSVGPGIRLLTPLGPIRFDYGYKLEPSPFEDRDTLHFSFAYPF